MSHKGIFFATLRRPRLLRSSWRDSVQPRSELFLRFFLLYSISISSKSLFLYFFCFYVYGAYEVCVVFITAITISYNSLSYSLHLFFFSFWAYLRGLMFTDSVQFSTCSPYQSLSQQVFEAFHSPLEHNPFLNPSPRKGGNPSGNNLSTVFEFFSLAEKEIKG